MRTRRIAKGDGLVPPLAGSPVQFKKDTSVGIDDETLQPLPSTAARAMDAAADISRTVGEVTGALRAAVDRLIEVVDEARRPGQPLATVAAMTREAPLTSLCIAFMFGIAIARRRR
jgi:hypothetical protein